MVKSRDIGSLYFSGDLQTALLPGLATWEWDHSKTSPRKEDINTTKFNRRPVGTGPSDS